MPTRLADTLSGIIFDTTGVVVTDHDERLASIIPNSLAFMTVIMTCQDAFGVDIDFSRLGWGGTVAQLAALIRDSRAAAPPSSLDGDQADSAADPAPAGRVAMNPMQTAYLMGGLDGLELGGAATFMYLELDLPCPAAQAADLVAQAVARHDAFACRLDEAAAEVVLDTATPPEPAAVRDRLLAEARRSNDGPRLHAWAVVGLPDGASRVCAFFNMVLMDAASAFILVRELDALRRGQPLPPAGSYLAAAALAARRKTPRRRDAARAYWQAKAPGLPPAPRFKPGVALYGGWATRRASATLPRDVADGLKRRAQAAGVTESAAVLAVHAAVIARWANQPRFTVNVTATERGGLPGQDSVVGDFTSSLLVGADVAAAESLDALAVALQQDIAGGLAHLAYSGVEVVHEFLRAESDPRSAPMPVVFTSFLEGAGADRAPGVGVGFTYTQTAQVFLDMQVTPDRDSVRVAWDYVPEYFDFPVQTMFDAAVAALAAYARGEAVLPIRDHAAEAAAAAYNQTAADLPGGTLLTAVRESFARHADRTALVSHAHGWRLSYAEVDRRSAQLAGWLADRGVAPGDVVVVESTKHPQSVVNQLAVLRAGGVFVPVSARYPAARRRQIAETAGAAPVWLADDTYDKVGVSRFPERFEDVATDPGTLAYIIFTSGSTGRPKGVEITHAAAVNTVNDVNARFGLGPDDVVIGLSALSFDLSVYDIYGAFAAGATLTMVDDERDADEILAVLAADGVTVWNSTPALVELALIRAGGAPPCRSLRLLMMSGDRIAPDLPARAAALFPDAAVYSLGGATEGSIWSIMCPLGGPADPSRIPYGYPLANQRIHVLGYDDAVCPVGVPGEICIGGAGVAAGYRGEPDKTAAAFQQVEPFGRLYRTGDVGLFNAQGYVEFLGRRDRQVKIRGHRVELGEIEAALARCPGVRSSAAAVVQLQGAPALAAFAVPDGAAVLDPDALRGHLAGQLPDYMVPQVVMAVPAVPVTAHGKVDQAALQALADGAAGGSKPARLDPGCAPMRALWERVLGRPVTDDHVSFLAVGGDSLKFQELLRQVRAETGRQLRFRDVIMTPTVSHMSHLVAEAPPAPPASQAAPPAPPATAAPAGPAAAPAVQTGRPVPSAGPAAAPETAADAAVWPDDPHAPFPLTDMQLAYLVGRGEGFDLGGVSEHYYVESENQLDLGRLEDAFNALIARHPMLRAVIADDGTQRVLPTVPRYRLAVRDVSGFSPEALADAIAERRAELSHQVFDPAAWPQYSLSAFDLGGGRCRLFFSVDMILADGASQQIIVEDLTRLYEGEEPLPAGGSFRDYVVNLRRQPAHPFGALDEERLARLAEDFPIGNFLPARSGPEAGGATRIRRLSHVFDAAQADCLRRQAAAAEVSLSALCAAAYAGSLALWATEPRVGVNVTTYNRDPAFGDCRHTVGDFTGVVPLSFDATWPRDVFDRARDAQRELLEQLDEGYAGVQLISEIARRKNAVGRAVAPFVFTSLLFDGPAAPSSRRAGSVFGDFKYAISQTPQVLLDNQLVELGGAVAVSWDYVEPVFDAAMMAELFEHYIATLNRCAAGDGTAPPVPPASAAAIKQALLARAAPAPTRPRRPAASAGRLDAAVAETVLALARRRLGRPSLTLDDNLFAAGLNSLAFVEF
ncbi:MAG: amino acid adenylation domain-containing protein, partial [Propionibacteriaceae bacterium]|nr:amino acid adenylation domain-containing protein [Propionibacteriaceae bacterium]